jgi:aryl-alcohol dehydrogenase-like predicted oxidoreductase
MRPGNLARAIRASLRRLGADHVDLYLLLAQRVGAAGGDVGRDAALDGAGTVAVRGGFDFGHNLIARCQAMAPVQAVENQLSMLHRDEEELATL